ncbi:hypothetical protein ACFXTI_040382 [Malus domestica]
MSLRKAFRSRKFSKSFRELKLSDEDQAHGGDRRVVHDSDCADSSSWSDMLLELLGEIIQRVEVSEDKWPHRKKCHRLCLSSPRRWRPQTAPRHWFLLQDVGSGCLVLGIRFWFIIVDFHKVKVVDDIAGFWFIIVDFHKSKLKTISPGFWFIIIGMQVLGQGLELRSGLRSRRLSLSLSV